MKKLLLLLTLTGCGVGGYSPVPNTSDMDLEMACPPFLRAKCPIPETVNGFSVTLYNGPLFYPGPDARDKTWVRAVPVAAVIGEGIGRRWQRYTCEELRDAPSNVLGIQCADAAQGWTLSGEKFDEYWKLAVRQR